MKHIDSDTLLNILHADSMRKAYQSIEVEQWDLSDIDLTNIVQPSRVDWRLRIRFWDLVDKATDTNNPYDKIYAVDVSENICGVKYFRSRFKKDCYAAFFFRPIEKYLDEAETMLAVTRSKMWQLVNSINPVSKDGEINEQQARMLMKIHDNLVDRKMGAVKQLVEMRKIKLNLNAGLTLSDDIEILDDQIRELRPAIDISEKQRTPKVTE